MNAIEGTININIFPQHKKGERVEITSSRPLKAAKVLIGKTPEQVLSIIPLLFSVCGIAQSRAALIAIEQKLGMVSAPPLETARDMLVLVENAKEHLFRLFIDWPKLFALEQNNNNLPYISQLSGEFISSLFNDGDAFSLHSELNSDLEKVDLLIDKLDAYLQHNVFSLSTKDWLAISDIGALHQWALQHDTVAAHSIRSICEQGWHSQGISKTGRLPVLDEESLMNRFDASDAQQFIAQPQWLGQCYETTTLTRQFEQPLIQALLREFDTTLITRWTARLVELANIPHQLRDLLQSISGTASTSTTPATSQPGRGLAQIEAARGRLIHRIEITQGVISNYQILAPTEWNFHPQGLAAKSLDSIVNKGSDQDIESVARLLINAIDPCVGYELRIH